MKFKTSIGRFGLALAGASLAASAIAGTVTSDRLINSEKEPGNWLNHHGNYEAHRFSGLSQINKENVKDLKVAFTFAMGGTQGGGKEVIAFHLLDLREHQPLKMDSSTSQLVGALSRSLTQTVEHHESCGNTTQHLIAITQRQSHAAVSTIVVRF